MLSFPTSRGTLQVSYFQPAARAAADYPPSQFAPVSTMNVLIVIKLNLACSVIALTEGGVIPATLVYLGGFYKSTELATRLAWFWGVQVSFALSTRRSHAKHCNRTSQAQSADSWPGALTIDEPPHYVLTSFTYQRPAPTTRRRRALRLEMALHRRRHHHALRRRAHLVRALLPLPHI